MIASRQVEIHFQRGIGRQPGRIFGALAQGFRRNAIPTLSNYVVPAAKCVGADWTEFAAPESAEVVKGRKIFKSAVKNVGSQTMRKL